MRSPAPKQPPSDARRKVVRHAARMQVRFGVHGLDRRAPVANVSEGGICIRTNEVYRAGSTLVMALELPWGEIRLRGEVLWAIRVPAHQTACMEHGMGVRFLDPGPEWQEAFARWTAESR